MREHVSHVTFGHSTQIFSSAKSFIGNRVIFKNNGCWECRGVSDKDGYVSIKIGKTQERVHRIAYALFCGKIHHTLYVLHSCDNKRCINPRHLFLGTQKDNIRDCIRKNRFAIGSRNGVSKLTELKVAQMRRLYDKYRKNGGLIQRELAKKFGVSRVLVSDITRGKTWKHVPLSS